MHIQSRKNRYEKIISVPKCQTAFEVTKKKCYNYIVGQLESTDKAITCILYLIIFLKQIMSSECAGLGLGNMAWKPYCTFLGCIAVHNIYLFIFNNLITFLQCTTYHIENCTMHHMSHHIHTICLWCDFYMVEGIVLELQTRRLPKARDHSSRLHFNICEYETSRYS